jgi:hypothetical protein
MVPNAFNNIL